MSNWNQPDDAWDSDSGDDDGQNQKPNPVRQRMRELEKQNKELKEQAEKLMAQVRQQEIRNTLEGKGYSPKVAALVPQTVEPTGEAIEKWLADHADVLKPTESSESQPAGEDGGEGEGDGDQGSQFGQQYGRMADATSAARSATTKDEDVVRKLQSKDLTQVELLEMIGAAGGGYGSG